MHNKSYTVKATVLSGRSYIDVERKARAHYKTIASRTRRNPYIRSKYFKKDKIFLKLFWEHVMQKHEGDRKRRLKYYTCAIELLRNTTLSPDTKMNPNGAREWVHRFYGRTSTGLRFCVQVKHDVKSGNKFFMSVFETK